jgi:hypothetical protein
VLKNWKLWLGVIIGAAALYFTLRNVDPALLAGAVGNANTQWAVPALALFAASIALRAARWAVLMGDTPFWTTLHANNIGYMLNMTLPLRIGEVGRAYVMSERAGIGITRALSAVVAERLLDLGCVVVIFAICAQFIPLVAQFSGAALIAGAIVAAGVVGAACMIWLGEPMARALGAILKRLRLPAEWPVAKLREVTGSVALMRTPRTLLLSLALSAGVWVTALGVQLCAMRMFLPANLEQSAFSMVMANLGGALPALPGGLGPAQLAAQQSLVIPFGIDENAAVAFVLVNQFAQQGLLILLGLIGLSRLGLKFAQVSAARGMGNTQP